MRGVGALLHTGRRSPFDLAMLSHRSESAQSLRKCCDAAIFAAREAAAFALISGVNFISAIPRAAGYIRLSACRMLASLPLNLSASPIAEGGSRAARGRGNGNAKAPAAR